MLRFGLPSDRDDLIQTGRLAALKAAGYYRPDRGVPLSAYVRLVVRQHLRAQVAQDLAVVHVPCGQRYHARDYQTRVPVEEADRHLDPSPSPEEEALAAEREQGLADWRRRVRDELREAMGELAPERRAAAWSVLVGQRRPGEVAQATGLPVRTVYAAVQRLRARIARSPALVCLWAARDNL